VFPISNPAPAVTETEQGHQQGYSPKKNTNAVIHSLFVFNFPPNRQDYGIVPQITFL